MLPNKTNNSFTNFLPTVTNNTIPDDTRFLSYVASSNNFSNLSNLVVKNQSEDDSATSEKSVHKIVKKPVSGEISNSTQLSRSELDSLFTRPINTNPGNLPDFSSPRNQNLVSEEVTFSQFSVPLETETVYHHVSTNDIFVVPITLSSGKGEISPPWLYKPTMEALGFDDDIIRILKNKAIATTESIGFVKASIDVNCISVQSNGVMEINNIDVKKLTVLDGDQLILDGGNSTNGR